ncbi:NifU family protein [Sphaerisporangium sp. NPDC051011]|uniref:NifU family protein n=1 Tax=Sphaerisporangium sp. NPDC051011 TaxID=3155792 RepID=UPI0033D86AFB
MSTTAAEQPRTERAQTEPAFTELAGRVDDAVRRVAELDGEARRTAEELKAAVEAVHRAGLVTIVRRMRADERARELLFELVDEPEVRLLLTLHGIIRPDPLTEAKRVLETVRPSLQSHGGDAELVRVEDGVAYVRLKGACNGCSMSSVTLRDGVEEALVNGVAGVTKVEVVPDEPSPTLIPLSAVRVGRDPREEGWVRTTPVEDVPDGKVTPMRLVTTTGKEVEVIVVRLGGRLNAYVNACAHQGMPLDAALLDGDAGTLTCPWHGFCYDAMSGECMSMPGAQLEQLPLRVDDGYVWIRGDA